MALLQVLSERVSPSSYTPLVEHVSRTPSTFFNAPPVLHLHCETCDIKIPSDLLITDGPLKSVFGALPPYIQASASAVPVQVTFEGVSVIVGSEYVGPCLYLAQSSLILTVAKAPSSSLHQQPTKLSQFRIHLLHSTQFNILPPFPPQTLSASMSTSKLLPPNPPLILLMISSSLSSSLNFLSPSTHPQPLLHPL